MSGGELDTRPLPETVPEERSSPLEALERQRAYWRRELQGAPSGLELPADRPRRAMPSFCGARRVLRLPAAMTARLKQAARSEGVTLHALLQAGFAALISRYSDAEDLLIGMPVGAGPSANLLPLRFQWQGDPPFRRLLTSGRESVRAALAHADVPFAALAEELWPERPARGLPLQALLSWQRAGGAAAAAQGEGREVSFPRLPSGEPKAELDLMLAVTELADETGEPALTLALTYAVDLFTGSTAARLLAHYTTLLVGAAAAPELRLSRLPLLGEAERHQLVVEWNDTAAPFPRRALHRLFEEQATARPDAVAVAWDQGALTFGGLDRQAGRIARRLRRLGVGPEARVALYVERSADMVAAVLGILKAGAAYLPLELSYPRERLEVLIADAAPAAIVGTRRHLAALGGPRGLLASLPGTMPRLAVEDLQTAAEGAGSPLGFSIEVPPESVAHVLYTSGSTGTPKGVEVTHQGIVRMVLETGYLAFGPGDVFLQQAMMSFDASTQEMWWPLLTGGCLALAPPGRLALTDLYQAVERHGVTTLFLTTGLFHVAVEEGLEGLAGLRSLLVGGDVMSRAHAEQALAALPRVAMLNGYGPTENTVITTGHRLHGDPGEGSVPIGRPVASNRVYVLDRRLEPLPVGCVGELCLGGAGVARGYLGAPELTAERFIPDPCGEGRLYRTGDLARWRPDGTLAFLGREDFQVKVRGFRIEPGEIETALLRHPQVREAVVVGLAEGGRDHRVVAYYVAAGEADGATPTGARPTVTATELRSFLRARVPEHMVPSAFVALPALPLNPIGKLDRQALPAPEELSPERGEGATAPRDPVEELIAGLWEEVLEPGRRIGVHDNFFDLGGHSISAMRLLSRIRQSVGVELGVQTLFAFPTVSALARVVSAARRSMENVLPPLTQVPRQGPLPLSIPLSFAQRRLWFLDRLAPGSSLYNVPTAWLLRGRLEPAALAAGLAAIVGRHETLRTRFVEVDGEPRQEIAPPDKAPSPAPPDQLPWPLPRFDLGGLAAERRERELLRLRLAEAGRPFDLARGPLLRAGLVRLRGEEHVLLLTVHHIVYDGWSEDVLVRELAALYDAALDGRPSPLGELPVQYADFAVWQRAWPPALMERQLAYWRQQLAGAPTALSLPADRPRPPVQSFRGDSRVLRLPAGVTAGLHQAARREGITLFMLLLASFGAVLARHLGEEDLLIGTPVAGRTRPEVEGLIGFFVNTLALRLRLPGDADFRRLLAVTRDTVLGAFAHQDLPFEVLVDELRPERDLSRHPLVQVLLVLQSAGQAAGAVRSETGLRLARMPFGERTTAKLDLSLSAMELEGGGGPELSLVLEYAADLYTAATAARLLAHYATLLGGAVAAPELPLSRLPLLDEAERHQLVAEWNDTAADFPRRTLHALFAEQAAARPEAVALAWEGGSLSYGELARRAGRIARRLRRLGVEADARVGLLVERAPEMVAAVLGILAAGGAYLPLDPSYPRERLEFLLVDSAAAAVVGPRRLLRTVFGPLGGTAPILAIEDLAAAEAPGAVEVPPDDVPPEGLVYVLYTSGSTGTPKGVEVSHEAVVRLVREAGYASFGPGEVFLQMSPMSFDAATLELWGPLLHGGRLALLPPGSFTLADLHEAVACHGVTAVHITTALFHLAVEEGLEGFAGLRQLLTGGEVMSRAHLERALAALPGVELIHCYGPTENTTFTTTYRVRSGLGEGSVTIGRPIASSQAHVLGGALEPLSVGSPGELYAGGAGLARGYLGQPDLTAERFVPDPFDASGGGRLYRTGDLARWRTDGTLEFLGRRDFQVKVRGFRVEPGEIESALLRHPRVREAVVVAHAEGGRDHRLAAYCVADAAGDGTPEVSGEELRAFLRQRLPEHMVPAAFVRLASLPLTPHGKIDRRALPAPEDLPADGGADAAATRIPPRNPVEEVIAGIWEEVLGLECALAIDDNFFHLGGHSLLAIRLLSRLREAFGVELPVRRVFEFPTLAALAEAVAAASRQAAGQGDRPILPPLVPLAQRDGVLPLSYPQLRLWFIDRLAPDSPTYNIPSGFLLRGPLDPAALAAALTEIVRRHEVLRTRIAVAHGQPGQEICPPAPLPLPLVDLGGLPLAYREPTLAALSREEGRRIFDLQRGPMLRATLVQMTSGKRGGEHALLLTLHHIASDGWSEGVLLRELSALYAAAVAGEPSPLAPLALQYADFAAWQRAWPEEALAAQLAYWKAQLAGTPALAIPSDRARPQVQSFRGDAVPLDLPPALTGALDHLARSSHATAFMTLLAAWHALLARHSGQADFAVGSPVANRTRPEIEPLVGFFVNMLVLRPGGGIASGAPGAPEEPTFAGLLARVRRTMLAAYDHADVPFERLVDELHPVRDLARQPLFQTMLAFNTTPQEAFALPGIEVFRFSSPSGVSRFDLSLGLADQGGWLAGYLEYSTDLFDRATMARLAGHFINLLSAVTADPSGRMAAIADIELLSAAERQQLVAEWNDTAADSRDAGLGGDTRLHRWIERQAARIPEAVAVVGEEESLSCGELDARANRLARHLRRLGVGIDEPVGICAERSPALVVGLLGILKAGGAYLPLDPSYPPERLAFMVEDGLAGLPTPVLLVQAPLASLLAGPGAAVGARTVDLDAAVHWPAELGASSELGRPEPGAGADNLAYVIYTSGSTGKPKGVMNTHRGIVNRLLWMQRDHGLTPSDRVLQKTPVSFDVSVWELFGPLLTGARLVLARPGGQRDPAYLTRRIAEQEITVAHFVPAMLQVFLEQPRPELDRCRCLRRVIASGEALPVDLARRFFALLRAELHNLYGPTEAAVEVAAHAGAPGEGERPAGSVRTVPIGRPIANLGLWLLDAGLQPVPLGVPGELFIGGVGLARGYLGRPDLTAERFVPHPLGGRPGERLVDLGGALGARQADLGGALGARLYRTGDLARFLPDGEIEFLGRTDDQVKVRGVRVEPGEIEAVLASHPGVREAAVVAREERPGEVRLVAYWVAASSPAPSEAELRQALRGVLPEAMVPADFVPLEALPLSPGGKLDRLALRSRPDLRPVQELAPSSEPENELETVLVEIWQDLLGRAPIGVHDHLFDLGANSLHALQFTVRVREALDLELPLQVIFASPRIKQLALALQDALLAQIESLTDEEAAMQAG